MKKIKKDCLKNMVAEPNHIDLNNLNSGKLSSFSYSLKKKHPSVHKNSLVGSGLCFNSDDENIKNQEKVDKKAINLINREAKTWKQ